MALPVNPTSSFRYSVTSPVALAPVCEQPISSDKAIRLNQSQARCLETLFSLDYECKIGDSFIPIKPRQLFGAFQRFLQQSSQEKGMNGVGNCINNLILSGGRMGDIIRSTIRPNGSDIDLLGSAKPKSNPYAVKEQFLVALKEQLGISEKGEWFEKTGGTIYCDSKILTVSLPLWTPVMGRNGQMIKIERPLDLRIVFEPSEKFSCTNSGNSIGSDVWPFFTDPNWDGTFVVTCRDGYEPERSIELFLQDQFYVLEGHAEETREGLRAYIADRTKAKSPTDTRCEVGYIKRWEQDYGFEEKGFNSFFEQLEKYLKRHFNKLSTPEDRFGAAHYFLNLRLFFASHKVSPHWLDKFDAQSSSILDGKQHGPSKLFLLLLFWLKLPKIDPAGIPWLNTLELLREIDRGAVVDGISDLLTCAGLPAYSREIKAFLWSQIGSLKNGGNPRTRLLESFAHQPSTPFLMIPSIAKAIPELDSYEFDQLAKFFPRVNGDGVEIGKVLQSLEPKERSSGLPFLHKLSLQKNKAWQPMIFDSLCELLPIPPSSKLPRFSFDEWGMLYSMADESIPDAMKNKLIGLIDRHLQFQINRQDPSDVKTHAQGFSKPLDVFKMVVALPSSYKQFIKLSFDLLENNPQHLAHLIALVQGVHPESPLANIPEGKTTLGELVRAFDALQEIPPLLLIEPYFALGKQGDKEAAARLIDLLSQVKDPIDPKLLAEMVHPPFVLPLAPALVSRSDIPPLLLIELYFALAKQGDKEAAARLIDLLSQVKDPIDPKLLAEMTHSSFVLSLAPALVSRSDIPPLLLIELYFALAKQGDKEAAAPLIDLLSQVKDPIDPKLLAEMAHSPFVLPLASALVSRSDIPPLLLIELYFALAKQGDKKAAARLIDLLSQVKDPIEPQLLAEMIGSRLAPDLMEALISPFRSEVLPILGRPEHRALLIQMVGQKRITPTEGWQWAERFLRKPDQIASAFELSRVCLDRENGRIPAITNFWKERLLNGVVSAEEIARNLKSFPLPILMRHQNLAEANPEVWIQHFERSPSLKDYKTLLNGSPRQQWGILTEAALTIARKEQRPQLFSSIWGIAYEQGCLTKEMGRALLFEKSNAQFLTHKQFSLLSTQAVLQLFEREDETGAREILDLFLAKLPSEQLSNTEVVEAVWKVLKRAAGLSMRLEPVEGKKEILQILLQRPFNRQGFLHKLLLAESLLCFDALAFLPIVKQPPLNRVFVDRGKGRLQAMVQSVKGSEEWTTEMVSFLLQLTDSKDHKNGAVESLLTLIPELHPSQVSPKQFDALLRLPRSISFQGSIARLAADSPAILKQHPVTIGNHSLAFLETLSPPLPAPDGQKFSSIARAVCAEAPSLAIKIALQLNRLESLAKPAELMRELVALGQRRLTEEFPLPLFEEILEKKLIDPESLWNALSLPAPTAKTLGPQMKFAQYCLKKTGGAVQAIDDHFGRIEADPKLLIPFFQTWDGPFSPLFVRLVNSALRLNDKQLNESALKFFLDKKALFFPLPLNDFWTLSYKFLRLPEMYRPLSVEERTVLRKHEKAHKIIVKSGILNPEATSTHSKLASQIEAEREALQSSGAKSSKEAKAVYELMLERLSQETVFEICSKTMSLYSDETLPPFMRDDIRILSMDIFWGAVKRSAQASDLSIFWKISEILSDNPSTAEDPGIWEKLFSAINEAIEKEPLSPFGKNPDFFQRAPLQQSLPFFLKRKETFLSLPLGDFWILSSRFLAMPRMCTDGYSLENVIPFSTSTTLENLLKQATARRLNKERLRPSEEAKAISDLSLKKLASENLSSVHTYSKLMRLYSDQNIAEPVRKQIRMDSEKIFWNAVKGIEEELTPLNFWVYAESLLSQPWMDNPADWETVFALVNKAIDRSKKPEISLSMRRQFFEKIPFSDGFDSLRGKAADLFWQTAEQEDQIRTPEFYKTCATFSSNPWFTEENHRGTWDRTWKHFLGRVQSPSSTPQENLRILADLWMMASPPFIQKIYAPITSVFWKNLDAISPPLPTGIFSFNSWRKSTDDQASLDQFIEGISFFALPHRIVALEQHGDWQKIFDRSVEKLNGSERDYGVMVALLRTFCAHLQIIKQEGGENRPLLTSQIPNLLFLAKKATALYSGSFPTSNEGLQEAEAIWTRLVTFVFDSNMDPQSQPYRELVTELSRQYQILQKNKIQIQTAYKMQFVHLLVPVESDDFPQCWGIVRDHLSDLILNKNRLTHSLFSQEWMETWKEFRPICFSMDELTSLWQMYRQVLNDGLLTSEAAVLSLLIYQYQVRDTLGSLFRAGGMEETIHRFLEDQNREKILIYRQLEKMSAEEIDPRYLNEHGGFHIAFERIGRQDSSVYLLMAISHHAELLKFSVSMNGKTPRISKLGETLFEAHLNHSSVTTSLFAKVYDHLFDVLEEPSFLRKRLMEAINQEKVFENSLPIRRVLIMELMSGLAKREKEQFHLTYAIEVVAFVKDAIESRGLKAAESEELLLKLRGALSATIKALQPVKLLTKDETTPDVYKKCAAGCINLWIKIGKLRKELEKRVGIRAKLINQQKDVEQTSFESFAKKFYGPEFYEKSILPDL